MKPSTWHTYRTKFIILATSIITFPASECLVIIFDFYSCCHFMHSYRRTVCHSISVVFQIQLCKSVFLACHLDFIVSLFVFCFVLFCFGMKCFYFPMGMNSSAQINKSLHSFCGFFFLIVFLLLHRFFYHFDSMFYHSAIKQKWIIHVLQPEAVYRLGTWKAFNEQACKQVWLRQWYGNNNAFFFLQCFKIVFFTSRRALTTLTCNYHIHTKPLHTVHT